MKPTQKLTLPPGIPQPPAPPKGCRWEVIGKGRNGGILELDGHVAAAINTTVSGDRWTVNRPNIFVGTASELLYLRAVPITTAKPIKRGKVKARVMWAELPQIFTEIPQVFYQRRPPTRKPMQVAVLPLDRYEAMVEQGVDAITQDMGLNEVVRAVLASFGITKPKRRAEK